MRSWLAEADDLTAAAALLDRFNREYDTPTPGAKAIAGRLGELEDTAVLLAGDGPDGVAVLRYRRAIFTPGLEAYLAELYVVPDRRRQGIGLALMDAVLDHARTAGADLIELGTSEDDHAARALYERCGFVRTEGPGGPVMYVYEREL